MYGLCGAVEKAGKAQDLVLAMRRQFAAGAAADTVEMVSAVSGTMALGAPKDGLLWRSRIAADPDGYAAGLNGEIFSLAGENGETAETFPRGPSIQPAEILLRLYRAHGVSFISRLRGFFTVVLWDPFTETLYLATDRFAQRPLYYRQTGESIRFSSKVGALLSPGSNIPSLDYHGITDFLVFGVPFGTRTYFQDVHILPAASVLAFRNGNLTIQPYWDIRFSPAGHALTNVDLAARLLGDALSAAIAELSAHPDTLEVPLSGGLDSRCIVASLRARNKPARTYTIGSEGSVDLRLGQLAAGTLGVPNQSWVLQPADLLGWIQEAVHLTEGMFSPLDSPILFIAKHLPPNVQVALDGANPYDGYYWFLDIPLSRLVPSKFSLLRMIRKTLDAALMDDRGQIPAGVLADGFHAAASGHLRATLNELAASVPPECDENLFDRTDFLFMRNRIRRFSVMGTVILRNFLEVRNPFLDPRVVDVYGRFTPRLRAQEKRVIGRILTSLDPRAGALEYQRTGLPADSSLFRHTAAYMGTALKRALGVLPVFKSAPRTAIDFSAWVQRDPSLQAFIREVLYDTRTRQRGYFRPDAVTRLAEDCFSGRTSDLRLLGRMLGLELWHRSFLEGESPNPG